MKVNFDSMIFILLCWTAVNSNRPIRDVEHHLGMRSTTNACGNEPCCTENLCLKGCFFEKKPKNASASKKEEVKKEAKKAKLMVFFDFDGTLELYDALAHDIMKGLPQGGKVVPTEGNIDTALHGVLHYNCALDYAEKKKEEDKANERTDKFIKSYFKDAARVDAIKKGFADIRKNGEVWILSAAWEAIPGEKWEYYLNKLTSDKEYGLQWRNEKDKTKNYIDGIIGVGDPGGSKKSNKGAVVKEKCENAKKVDKDVVCIHVDNSLAYVMQSVAHGYGGVSVKTCVPQGKPNPTNTNSVTAGTFKIIEGMRESAGRTGDHGCYVPPYKPDLAWNEKTFEWYLKP